MRHDRPVADEPFRFRVASAFSLTGRGTVVLGYIEAGTFSVGDRLRVDRQGGPVGVCEDWGGTRMADWTPGDPVLVGLKRPALARDDVSEGDFLVSDFLDE